MRVTPNTSEPSARLDPHRWFAEQVHVHEGQLKAYLRGSFPGMPEVDDVVQESYLRIWKTRAVQPIHSARGFLFQVARRLAIDLIRRRKNSRTIAVCDLAALPVLDHGPSASDAACHREQLWLLAQAIHALPARCRQVMILRKIEGLSQKEIAVRLGISEGTVQVHIGRGLRHLEDFFLKIETRRP